MANWKVFLNAFRLSSLSTSLHSHFVSFVQIHILISSYTYRTAYEEQTQRLSSVAWAFSNVYGVFLCVQLSRKVQKSIETTKVRRTNNCRHGSGKEDSVGSAHLNMTRKMECLKLRPLSYLGHVYPRKCYQSFVCARPATHCQNAGKSHHMTSRHWSVASILGAKVTTGQT